MPPAGGTLIEEPSAFSEADFGELPPLESALAETALTESAPAHKPSPASLDDLGDGAEVPPPVAEPPPPTTSGIAYITVTDAAGRVLFRRAATPNEVTDALRSADAAQAEAEAAMDRISYDRLFRDLNAGSGAAGPESRTS